MTDDDPDPQRAVDRLLALAKWLPFFGPGDLLNASEQAVWAVLQLVALAHEADPEATGEVLREHEDAFDTVVALAKIVRGREE